MRKLFISLFVLLVFIVNNTVSAQCDNNFISTNTGGNMTLFLTPPSVSGSVLSEGDSIGVFYLDENNEEQGSNYELWNGSSISIAAMGDDATTSEKDGFYAGDEIFWRAKTVAGTVYIIEVVPSDTYTASGMSFISSIAYTELDCGSSDILGCTSSLACNYDATATVDDGSCVEPELYYDCDGNCLADADQDGVCDMLEINGCTDATATNYDVTATEDDGSCEYSSASCELPSPFTGNTGSNMTVFLSTAFINSLGDLIEGAYVVAVTADNLVCGSANVYGESSNTIAIWGDDTQTPEVDGAMANELVSLQLVNGNGLYDIYDGALELTISFVGNGLMGLSNAVSTSLNCTGSETSDVDGCTNALACNYDAAATVDDGSCVEPELYYDCDGNCLADADQDGVCDMLEVNGCTDATATNYDATATEDDGSCEYSSASCELPSSFTGNTGSNMTVFLSTAFINSLGDLIEGAYVVAVTSDNLVCGSANVYGESSNTIAIWGDDTQTPEVDGAMANELVSIQLVNGNGLYDIYDGSIALTISFVGNGLLGLSSAVSTSLNCTGSETSDISGCTNALACNYDATATLDDGSCVFPELGYDCEGDCLDPVNSPCEFEPIYGCTDSNAINYNADATEDDGSCEYEVATCDLPTFYDGNTGSNMTVMFTPDFVSSFSLSNPDDAFIIASTNSGLAIGSVYFIETEDFGVGLSQGQGSMAIWADDTTTPETDGALANETVIFQLVDGINVYDIYDGGLPVSISYTGGMMVFENAVTTSLSCEGEIVAIEGCTVSNACNYNEDATEDDGSCIYAMPNYDCNGDCIDDADNDGICDIDEEYGCTDVEATNYDADATEDDGSCEYPPVIEGCTDQEANNYNPEANTDDGSCLYGVGACTYSEATNYNENATYDDGSCEFDIPFIYVTNPIDDGIYTTSVVNVQYEVVNFDIGIPVQLPDGGHLRYSVDGGNYTPLFNQSGEFELELENGEHTIDFMIYTNVSQNMVPWWPSIQNTITFTVGVEGCMNPIAGNFNPDAVVSDDSCIANADLDFTNNNTGNNHTILVLADEIFVNGMYAQEGDLVGVFYLNNGSYYGAGYGTFTGSTMQFSAWGDDATTTGVQDGFLTGQEFVWAIQFQETGNSVFIEANYSAPGMDVFTTNAISTIVSFGEMELTDVPGCMDENYLEFNPFATIDNGSCQTLIVYGCMDDSFIEYWDYDEVNHTISEPTSGVNTEDGSCSTLIIEGCTSQDYLEYCDVCNVMDMSECVTEAIYGCMDSIAENYNPIANANDGSCEYSLCVQVDMDDFDISFSTALNSTVFSLSLNNNSDIVVLNPEVQVYLEDNPVIEISETANYGSSNFTPNGSLLVSNEITSDLALIDAYMLVSGQVHLYGVNQYDQNVDCWFDFTDVYMPTTHVGCTDVNAYNYEPNTTVDDGSCIDNLSASIVANDPSCADEYGNATIYVTGGIPGYSSPTTYTSYLFDGEPTDSVVNINANGVAYMTGLAPGDYIVEIHDSVEIISFYNFTIEPASDVSVEAQVQNSGLLTSTVTEGNAVFYQWLLNGESVEGANSMSHYASEIGYYQVYIENSNGCGAYSDEVYLSFVGVEELSAKSMSLYPNPVESNLIVSLVQLDNEVELKISNMLGQSLRSFNLDSRDHGITQEIDLSDLASGTYFITLVSDNRAITKRFVKD